MALLLYSMVSWYNKVGGCRLYVASCWHIDKLLSLLILLSWHIQSHSLTWHSYLMQMQNECLITCLVIQAKPKVLIEQVLGHTHARTFFFVRRILVSGKSQKKWKPTMKYKKEHNKINSCRRRPEFKNISFFTYKNMYLVKAHHHFSVQSQFVYFISHLHTFPM